MERHARIHKKTLPDGTAADEILIWDGSEWTVGDITDLTAILPSGTAAGQMLFWTGTAWAYTEVTELFWDDTNKWIEPDKLATIDSNGDIAVYIDSDEFYVSLPAAATPVATGNPIGLLLALTYTV